MDDRETKRVAALTATDWGSPVHVHALVLMVLTGAGIYFCYLLAAPFFPALAWALALAVLFAPVRRWLESKVKWPNPAATLCVLVVVLVVVVPAMFLAERVASEVASGAETVRAAVDALAHRVCVDRRRLDCSRPSGLIFGPVLFTVTRALLEVWRRRNAVDSV